jgi:hypothetical protein
MGNEAFDTPSLLTWPTDVPFTPDAAVKMMEAMTRTGQGAGAPDRLVQTKVVALTGAAIHAGTGGVIAWQNPEGATIIILRVLLHLTTVATAACTLDIGVTAVGATTSSDTLLDGIDVNSAVGLFDSMNAALDGGANALAQSLASGKWITIDEKTGDATGLVANLIIQYILA